MMVLIAHFSSNSIGRVMTSPAAPSAPTTRLPARQFRLVHVFVLMAALAIVLAIGTQMGVEGLFSAAILTVLFTSMALGWWFGHVWWVIVPAGLLALVVMLFPSVSCPPRHGLQCQNNLRQVVLALQSYHIAYKAFPPAYVADQAGQPLYSWRVLILPFMEQNDLYDQFHLDEPWNSRHNLTLVDKMGDVYRCPVRSPGRTGSITNYVAIVGDETMWPGASSLALKDATDGKSNTLLVVEWSESDVVWSEPRDIPMKELKKWWLVPRQVLKGKHRHPHGVHVGFVDGHTDSLRPQFLSGPELRSLLTPAGNDTPAKSIAELER
jgi:prepilin-type processing-associated H-X9-DG protein